MSEDMPPPQDHDYDEAFQKLRTRYCAKLMAQIAEMDAWLVMAAQKPPRRDMLLAAQSLAHALAGSGMIYGFPDISKYGHAADVLITHQLQEDNDALSGQDDPDSASIRAALGDLRAACVAALST